MRTSFSAWLESRGARDAVIGVFSGGDDPDRSEVGHLLSRKATDFSSEIRRRLKELGAVRSLPTPARISFERAVDEGATVSELVGMLSTQGLKEGRHESDMDAMNRALDRRFERELRRPARMKASRSRVRP